MKRKLFISAMFLCLAACFQAWAQDVEGVEVGTTMTKAQVIAKFGQPDEYYLGDSSGIGVDEWYHYNNKYLVFYDSKLSGFYIGDNKWAILTKRITNGVKVGDSFSKLLGLNPQKATWIDDITYYIPQGDYCLFFEVKNAIITAIFFEFTT